MGEKNRDTMKTGRMGIGDPGTKEGDGSKKSFHGVLGCTIRDRISTIQDVFVEKYVLFVCLPWFHAGAQAQDICLVFVFNSMFSFLLFPLVSRIV